MQVEMSSSARAHSETLLPRKRGGKNYKFSRVQNFHLELGNRPGEQEEEGPHANPGRGRPRGNMQGIGCDVGQVDRHVGGEAGERLSQPNPTVTQRPNAKTCLIRLRLSYPIRYQGIEYRYAGEGKGWVA